MKTKVALTTLGCKVNQVESAALDNAFSAAGCELVDFRGQAEIYVVNTCAVTGRAGQQSRQMVRAALRRNPAALVVVTGCYAQIAAEEMAAIDTRVLVVGNSHKERLVQAALDGLQALHAGEPVTHGLPYILPMTQKKEVFALPVRQFPGHTRAFLRIQDGCNNFCAYCIVPYTRGRSRSLPLAEVLAQAERFVGAGYREIVVTGINVGKYGLDLAEHENIVSLLSRLCEMFPEIRFRLSSTEPTEIDDFLLNMAATHENFMPHFHIPLQSGDDRVLAAMRRKYTISEFREKVATLRTRFPFAALACDVITGFPGETDGEAANTRALLEECTINFLHVFPYSKRPGTPAATMPGQIATAVRNERARLLHELDAELRRRFYAANLGRIHKVLVERKVPGGLLEGHSENYIPLRFAGPETLVKTVVPVRLARLDATGNPVAEMV